MQDPEQSYFWLRRQDPPYHHAIRLLVERMHQARRRNPFPISWDYLNALKSICNQEGNDLEYAQICLECAWAAYKIDRPDRTITEIQTAFNLLKCQVDLIPLAKHWRAVGYWMLGSLLRHSPDRMKEAIVAWQNSLDDFLILAYHYDILSEDQIWYQMRCDQMHVKINNLINGKPGARPGAAIQPQPPAPAPRPRAPKWPVGGPRGAQRAIINPGSHDSISVWGEIRAGDFSSSGIDTSPRETMRLQPGMDQLNINGCIHRLYNFPGKGSEIRLVSAEQYYLLKVMGDSMNRAFIDPGDYVLLRFQTGANDRDIVAAQARSMEPMATLKLLRKHEDGTIELLPLSTNKTNPSFKFKSPSEDELSICGVVLGVFKAEG